MRKKVLLWCCLVFLALVGCREKDVAEPFLQLDKNMILVGAESSFAEFQVTSNEDWTMFCTEDWIDLSPKKAKGAPDPVTVTIAIKPNNGPDKRVATIEVSTASLDKMVTIRQEGAKEGTIEPKLVISANELTVSADAGTADISVTSNIEWVATVSDDWISLNPESGGGDETETNVEIHYLANESDHARSTIIEFVAGSKVVEVILKQDARIVELTPYLSITPTKIQVPAEESLVYVDVDSNVDWISTSDVEWLSLDKCQGNGNEKVEIKVQTNESEQTRSAVICFEIENTKEYLTVIQSGFQPVITLSEEVVQFSDQSAEIVIDVLSNMGWKASTDVDWIELTPSSSARSEDSVPVKIIVDTNTSESSRSAIVTFTAGSVTQILKVVQSGFVPELSISHSSIEASYNSEKHHLELKSNTSWSAETDSDWIELSPSSGVGSDAMTSVLISISANTSESSRSAIVTFTAGSVTKTLTLTQSGRPKAGIDDGSDAGIDDWIKDDDELTAN